jgi:hypothetical protein
MSVAEQYNGGTFHSDTDEPIDHGGSGDEADGGGGGKEEEEEKLDPQLVMEQLLSCLDELEAVENGDSDEELAEVEMKYNHLLWRGRCWNGEFVRIPRRASRRAAEDTLRYRRNYPDIPTGKFLPYLNDNSDFYQNRRAAYPCGEFIDNMHTKWWGKYKKLETEKNYIEWLFPIREIGTNWHAQDLQIREVKTIIGDRGGKIRILSSYEMMLDFWGMRLKDHAAGILERNPAGWRARFKCLNSSSSCHRHITRMFKFLGEVDHEKYKPPFVEFILREAITEGTLPNTLDPCLEYWVDLIRSGRERRRLRRLARQLAREHNLRVLEKRDSR